MTADDVTDAMVRAALSKWFDDPPSGEVEYLRALAPAMRETIAAAINASGCVLVPRNVLDDLLHEGHLFEGRCPDSAQPDARDPECPMCRAMLAAADPRQQALDRMAENAQELGLYNDGKEKGDE